MRTINMIEYKSVQEKEIQRISSAHVDGPISLTWLWEIIVRTKRLPDDLDKTILFLVMQDRLRNAEREVRQHALRVLSDLISIIPNNDLDKEMQLLYPDLIINLSHIAPAVRKSTIDVLKMYLKHSPQPDFVVKELLTLVPHENHLKQGLLIAVPYFCNHMFAEKTLLFLLQQLFSGLNHEFLKETSMNSLLKTRNRIGAERFRHLLNEQQMEEFKKFDNVILETQITLDSGSAITMKIHEESNDFPRSPRKVRFGGEVVKMRTPESDSNHQSSDDDQTTTIKITVSKAKHKSLIPIRVSSNPSSPRKIIKQRLHKSESDLRTSKIPLRYKTKPVSPIPVHNEIELFHNLTRSPQREKEDVEETKEEEVKEEFKSFQLCHVNDLSPLQVTLRDLTHKDDIWSKSRALDDLIFLLNQTKLDQTLVSELLEKLFLLEKQPRLQQRALQSIALVIEKMELEKLKEIYNDLCNDIVKLSPPSGVRLAICVMQRTSPKLFLDTIKIEPECQESFLQVLIAATRTYPSSEIDLAKGISIAFEAMKSEKRSIKQAALEALASLAQVAGNTMILEAITSLSKNIDTHLLTIVRTRLSRRQLPTVDTEGNVRYSSPREQEEFDWLCGGHNWTSKDGDSFPKIDNGTLCPVYVLQSQINGKNRNYDRGRSNSPPVRNDGNKGFYPQQFRKSFSSEHINNVKRQEISLSSRSSTTSTGSSTKSGIWFKSLSSAIPVPIHSESKLKFRVQQRPVDVFARPVVAQDLNRTKLESPMIRRSSAQKFTQLQPPPSSGSESSGYFTPPSVKEPEDTEENNNFLESSSNPNFEIIESEASENEPQPRELSASSAESKSFLDEVDFTQNSQNIEPRSKSRLEDFKTSLPEIVERKIVNSAPPLNEYNFEESIIKVSLPGSIDSTQNTPIKSPIIISPKRLPRRSISVKRSSRTKSKEVLTQTLMEMESCDWESIMKGLNNLIRLSRNEPEVLEAQIHTIAVILGKNIKNLRSQVARLACQASNELFGSCKKNLEMDLEELAAPLLQRTADTNKFLRSDANSALDSMSLNLSVSRVAAVVASKGSTHQNCIVRAAATRILSDIVMRLGSERIFQLPKETRDKFLSVGANALTEGSLDSRRYAKALMGALVGHQMFQKALTEAVPQHTMRHIAKVLNSLK